MTKKQYNPSTEALKSKPRKGFNNLVEEFYSRIGQRFPVTWKQQNGVATPEIDTDQLPDGITESDVENVLNNMKTDGWF